MPAYVFTNLQVTDPNGYEAYRSRTRATIEAFGGRFLARGGAVEVREGAYRPERVILLEFPNMAAARGWYDSSAYQEIIPHRLSTARTDLMLFDGIQAETDS